MFNWREFFEKETYTEDELELAVEEADGWSIEEEANIPRNEFGEPNDIMLYQLGMNFYDEVADMEMWQSNEEMFGHCKQRAKELFHRIEHRIATIK